ncbi:MAG: SHOCT domain-containing protein [bacterium]
MARLRSVSGALGIVSLIVLIGSTSLFFPNLAVATGSPQVSTAIVIDQQNSMQLSSGSQMYIYGAAGGGAGPMSPFSFTNDGSETINDSAGVIAVQIALTSSDFNSYSSNLMYYAIGGVGIQGFKSFTAIYGSNSTPGATGASIAFSLNQPALIVVVALASSQDLISISGIPGLIIDASNNDSSHSSEAIMIGHAYLNSGSYDVIEHSANTVYAVPQNRADLIGIFEFFSTSSVTPPPSKSVYIWITIAVVVVSVAMVMTLTILKRRRRQKIFKPKTKTENAQEGLSDESIRRLTKLKELYDKGLITQQEYEKERKKIIG